MASFENFSKLDLRVGRVLEAERIEGSEKLLKLQVSLGEETRQILAGIAKSYLPETLIGKSIIVIANLDSRKMMGHESQGMLLAAATGERSVLIIPDSEVLPGAKIS